MLDHLKLLTRELKCLRTVQSGKGQAIKTLQHLILGMILMSIGSAALAENTLKKEQRILDLAGEFKDSAFLGNTGALKERALAIEAKIGELFGKRASTKCIPRRVRDLSTAWRDFSESLDSNDAGRIRDAALEMHHQAYERSKMFTRCWRSLLARDRLLRLSDKAVADIVRVEW